MSLACSDAFKVSVSGLSYGTDDTSLREAFSSYGDVIEGIHKPLYFLNFVMTSGIRT